MSNGDVQTYEREGAWHNRLVGFAEVEGSHPMKADAVAEGRALARALQVGHHIGIQEAGPAN